MSIKTSFEDLNKMGKTRRQVFLACNAQRGGTMGTENDMHLNRGLADHYGWLSYNTIRGNPVKVGSIPQDVEDSVVAVEYDNTQNNQPITEHWEDTVTVGTRSTLRITNTSLITLSQTITIANVAESGFSIQVGTESTSEESVEQLTTTKRNFTITVGPHENVKIIRTRTELGSIATYHPYGLNTRAMIATTFQADGAMYNGHYHWGYYLNDILGNPGGNVVLNGTSKNTNYRFQVIRTGPTKSGLTKVCAVDPRTGESLELPLQDEVTSLPDAALRIAYPGI
ncbi:hypothetical protein JB92DRAFT_3104146 [Gautieria morchelliformis]|nr:hypothetical protein JB92DRAFT_3104146 [Gautieria morchelliformis]